jgi:integrase/recombinase XerD
MTDEQLPMFPLGRPHTEAQPAPPGLTPASPLADALPAFDEQMRRKEFADNTISSFAGDMRLFVDHAGAKRPLGELAEKDLAGFLRFLQEERDAPCSPKSLARRLTTLKVFFGWLAESGVLPHDPAAALVHEPAHSPLPYLLSADQIARVLEVTRSMRDAGEAPDARPHLLVTLLLATAIKKSECLRITLEQIDLRDPHRPTVYIHYDKPRLRLKSRLLALPVDWPATLEPYLRRYQPRHRLFECTGRNLEYMLHALSTLAGLHTKLTFEMLRWTSAVNSYQSGMDPDRLRRRLGLSPIAWRSTWPTIEKLAEGPL